MTLPNIIGGVIVVGGIIGLAISRAVYGRSWWW